MPSTAKIIPLPQPSFSGKMPRKPKNKDVRSREYLTDKEVELLMKAARNTGRHGHRDATLILVAYRPGPPRLRTRGVAVGPGRPCPGAPARHQGKAWYALHSHPIRGPEIRALRRLKRVSRVTQ